MQSRLCANHWICVSVSAGSREAAYMYAVISAGVTYALMDACSRGNVSICGCDAHYPSAPEDAAAVAAATAAAAAAAAWKWGGCSVDVAFGTGFARKFLDAQESSRAAGDARSLMNLHNNKVGRKVNATPRRATN